MSDFPTLDQAVQLGIAISRFDTNALRDELARKRAKMRALGWPVYTPDLDSDLADVIELAQRLVRGEVSAAWLSALSARTDPDETSVE